MYWGKMPWWQERVTGQIVHFWVNRKQRELSCLCSFIQVPSPWMWYQPWSGCVFPSQLILPENAPTDMPRSASHWSSLLYMQSSWQWKTTITSPWKFLLRFKLLNSEFSWVGDKPFAWQSLGTVDTVQTPSMKASVFFDVLFSTTVTSGWPGQSYQLDDYCLTLP